MQVLSGKSKMKSDLKWKCLSKRVYENWCGYQVRGPEGLLYFPSPFHVSYLCYIRKIIISLSEWKADVSISLSCKQLVNHYTDFLFLLKLVRKGKIIGSKG